jgi:hypothetical protein
LLLGGLVVGFLSCYFLLWWGALVIGVLVLGILSATLAGKLARDAAVGGTLGLVVGYVGVLALAAFRGALF